MEVDLVEEFLVAKNSSYGEDRARLFIQFIPQLPLDFLEIQSTKEEIWEILDEWDQWGNMDTPYYSEALETLLPFIPADRLPSVWEKIIKLENSDNYEKQIFAERQLCILARFSARDMNAKYLQRVDFEKFVVPHYAAELLVILGNCIAPGERNKKHSQALRLLDQSIERPEHVYKQISPDLLYIKWTELINQVRENKGQGYIEQWPILEIISNYLPEEKILEACYEIVNLLILSFYNFSRISLILNLIKSGSQDKQNDYWEQVFKFVTEVECFPSYQDNHELAGELICAMPEVIRQGKWKRLVRLIRYSSSSFGHLT